MELDNSDIVHTGIYHIKTCSKIYNFFLDVLNALLNIYKETCHYLQILRYAFVMF